MRLEEAMQDDEQDKTRLTAQKDKMDAYVAAEGEAAMAKQNVDTPIDVEMNEDEPNQLQEGLNKPDEMMDVIFDNAPDSSKDIRVAVAIPVSPSVKLDERLPASSEARMQTPNREPMKATNVEMQPRRPRGVQKCRPMLRDPIESSSSLKLNRQ